uniref:Uncharacterized protein n=1 Tax=Lymantria dispar multicapsid nuclear polyhedrosis virus TaxID=10449 RepID=A0A1B1MR56_NPVLD|nr:hypothetical protein [Lymantria dispar multiple nucleopolyhedrovirus]
MQTKSDDVLAANFVDYLHNIRMIADFVKQYFADDDENELNYKEFIGTVLKLLNDLIDDYFDQTFKLWATAGSSPNRLPANFGHELRLVKQDIEQEQSKSDFADHDKRPFDKLVDLLEGALA